MGNEKRDMNIKIITSKAEYIERFLEFDRNMNITYNLTKINNIIM